MRKLWSLAIPIFLTPFVLASAAEPVKMNIKSKDVHYEQAGDPLMGYMAWDDSVSPDVKRPGVLIVHEWWGLNDYAKSRADDLAKLGYVAFALDMYGKGKATVQPMQALEWSKKARSDKRKWRERALSGLDQLKKHPGVDVDKLAAIGYCFGGSTVIELAYANAPVKGVVSFHGALTPPDVEAKVNPKVLVCVGGADTSIPAAQVDAFVFGMERSKADYTVVTFGGARHAFTNPDAGRYGIANIAYDAEADHRSWQYMQIFFDEIFDQNSSK